jgi:multidrug efflux system membrane fusion protein
VPRRRRHALWLLCGALLALIAAGVIWVRKNAASRAAESRPKTPPPVVVATSVAQKGDIGVHVNALGLVTAEYTVNVRSRVDGQLVKIHYTEGQLVKKGAPLAEIDDAPYRAALLQAEGQLGRDTAILENARRDLERYGEALERNAIPRQQYDTQIATVQQYEDVLKVDQGQLDSARVNLAYCHIKAPISGRVGLRLVDPGNIVHASDENPLLVITQVDPIAVVFSVAEDFLPEIQAELKKGHELSVVAFDRAQKERLAEGKLKTLDNQIDPATGTIKLKALFPNEDGALFPNQFVNAQLLVDTHRDVTLVENPVIQRNAQGTFVYVVTSEEKVRLHPVQVVTTDGKRSEIDGLESGSVLAADNFNRLMDGAKVKRRPTTARPSEKPGE